MLDIVVKNSSNTPVILNKRKKHINLSNNNTNFSICSFNLFNYIAPPNAYYDLDNIYSEKQWNRKERWISQQLSELAPDIVGFQEVFSPTALKALVAKQGLNHFVTVSKPNKRSQYVYESPVVALASRYPIVSADTVKASAHLVRKLGLSPSFQFSRPPIRAIIQVDDFSRILVYVVHLKSKRPIMDEREENTEKQMATTILAEVQGRWASTIQRGTESAVLYHDMVQQTKKSELPVIVMGDLNDTIESEALQPLIDCQQLDKLDGKFIGSMTLADRRAVQRYSLYDAYDIQESPSKEERQSTHYFANKGSALDYILMSKDFHHDYDQSLASVVDYRVSDAHLINPHSIHDAECSDHAPVMVTVEIRF